MLTERTIHRPQKNAAFTLVEIMVAIVIIAILMSLLLPALGRVRTTARIQEVKTDMDKLTTALTQFKTRFNVDVPGSITLYETGAQWLTGADGPRSRGIIRQIWPQFAFGDTNFNAHTGDTDTADIIRLDGAECLVFFLGGVIDPNSGALSGFSKNPVNPFATGGNREGPFFEFRGGFAGNVGSGRLVDRDGDRFPEYLDPIQGQTEPYLYFANGYRTINDGNGNWVNADNWIPATPPPPHDSYQRMQRAYYISIANNTYPGGATGSVPHNKSTFQLISPGFDFEYGAGGVFDPNNDANNIGLAAEDADNITNFHSGQLRQ